MTTELIFLIIAADLLLLALAILANACRRMNRAIELHESVVESPSFHYLMSAYESGFKEGRESAHGLSLSQDGRTLPIETTLGGHS